jgi:hypothetical protein
MHLNISLESEETRREREHPAYEKGWKAAITMMDVSMKTMANELVVRGGSNEGAKLIDETRKSLIKMLG